MPLTVEDHLFTLAMMEVERRGGREGFTAEEYARVGHLPWGCVEALLRALRGRRLTLDARVVRACGEATPCGQGGHRGFFAYRAGQHLRASRADALRDGVLIDISPTAREAGIRYPVALTRIVWERCVRVPAGVLCQDEAGRLWDVLWMLACAIRRRNGGRVVAFALHVRNDNRDRTPSLARLQAVCGPGDDCEPVVAVMMVDED
jgi:hypothetical protein